MPDSNTLLVIILDVSPEAWGSRGLQRKAQDKKRAEVNKPSMGPAILEEVLDAIQAFSSAVCSIEREAGLIVIGVADGEIAVLYPRKDGTCLVHFFVDLLVQHICVVAFLTSNEFGYIYLFFSGSTNLLHSTIGMVGTSRILSTESARPGGTVGGRCGRIGRQSIGTGRKGYCLSQCGHGSGLLPGVVPHQPLPCGGQIFGGYECPIGR